MMKKEIRLNLPNGIGDALYATPTIEVLGRQGYRVLVSTPHKAVFEDNPHVQLVGEPGSGFFKPTYQDAARCTRTGDFPRIHNIYAVYEAICRRFSLDIPLPEPKPIFYRPMPRKYIGEENIGVQVIEKGLYQKKKRWPYARQLAQKYGFEPIKRQKSLRDLIDLLWCYPLVVAMEGGIAHLCQALGVPCVVIYGGFQDPAWSGYPNNINICKVPDCGVCFNKKPCDRKCMREISIQDVLRGCTLCQRKRSL